MLLYWMLFFIPAFFAMAGQQRINKNGEGVYTFNIDTLWLLLILVLTLFIGLRVEVGGDWFSYIRLYA